MGRDMEEEYEDMSIDEVVEAIESTLYDDEDCYEELDFNDD